MKRNLLFLMLCFGCFSIWAQSPIAPELRFEYTAEDMVMTEIPLEKLRAEDAANEGLKMGPWRFGYEMDVDIDPSEDGQFFTMDNRDRVWLYHLSSPGARTINLIFDWFKLTGGAKVTLYNNKEVVLQYDQNQNNDEQMLGTWLLDGDDVWIELYEPYETIGHNRLGIGTVVHGYRSIPDENLNKNLNSSGPCNQDVDCDITPPGSDPFNLDQKKDDVKKSVGMMVIGSGFCSGALINNTANDGTPYFLTANHCLPSNPNSIAAIAFRFNWRSPNPVCSSTQTSQNGSFNQTTSGAVLRARNVGSDVGLLEITDTNFFNNNPDVVFAGWDRTNSRASATFGIHHPRGDIQKVCRDDQVPNFVNVGSAQCWLVNNWDLGVTEGGSSGSPLFNQDGRIIGQLFGGQAACAGTNDNGQPDWYGRFDVSWDNGTTSSRRLRDWLDPNNTGATTIDLYDPNTASIAEVNNERLSIYPNPTSSTVTITGDLINSQSSIVLYDISGREVYSEQLVNQSAVIDLSSYRTGVYLLKVNSNGSSTVRKLVRR